MKLCDVVLDLIPLVNDDIASEASRKFVMEHCEECEVCRSMLQNKKSDINDQKVIGELKTKMRVVLGGCLCLCVLFAVCLSNFEAILQNILIMPLIGAIGYRLFKRDHWVLYIYTPICLTVFYLFTEGFMFVLKGGSLFYSIIYDSLIFIGFLIAYLFTYALKGGK